MNERDLKIQETDHYLQKALFELMAVYSWQEITVTALCRQAEIGRKTFYRHFRTLEDVLDHFFAQKAEAYLESFPPMTVFDPQQIQLNFFGFWSSYQAELKAVQHACGYGSVTSRILKHAGPVVEHRSQKQTLLFPLYSAGGLCAVLEQWTASGTACPPEQLARQLGTEQRELAKAGFKEHP